MAKRKKILKVAVGVLVGFFIAQMLTTTKLTQDICAAIAPKQQLKLDKLINENDKSRHDNNLLFVGVMTASKYLDTRAKAVYETWGRNVPGKIIFFSSENSFSDNIPLVALPGVDDSYPPQKKSFMMLKHMYDNYIDQYEWFLRADDDVYIRMDRLEELLRSVDSRKTWFIGQTGRGNHEEFGLLSLESDENFCMGGPGVILSRETLRKMAPYVNECLNNLYTTHEDVELGRCVRRFAGISCTWSYEMQVILYHNKSGQAAFAGDLKQKEVHRAITLHPVKQPQYMYRLHKYIKSLKVLDYQQESVHLHRDIASSMSHLGYRKSNLAKAQLVPDLKLFPEPRGSPKYLGDTTILGVRPSITKYSPKTLEDVLDWELISKSLYSHRDFNPKKRIGSSLKEGLGDVVREVMELSNSFSKQRGRIIDFKEILYGYWRLDPVHGADLILDLLLMYRKYRGHKMTVQVRRHVYVQQVFTGLYIREISKPLSTRVQTSTNSLPVHKKIVSQLISGIEKNLQPIIKFTNDRKEETINFILPLSGRYEIFTRFLKMYEDTCIKGEEETHLYIMLYKSELNPEDWDKTTKLIENIQNKYTNSRITVSYVYETFTRAKALQYGVNLVEKDSLLFFIDVDIIFTIKTLQRIRQNTMLNTFVYFPVVYSLYNFKLLNSSVDTLDYKSFTNQNIINEDNGYWRQYGYGIVGIYKSDYENLGGLNLSISGWGFEDVTFYDNAVKTKIKLVRGVDPSLIHVYHTVVCNNDLELSQKTMCINTKASTLGSLTQLQKVYKQFQYLFR